ncbi:MAG: hypothetical protein A2270_10860 [Elusimicrobia bacterium RIFOXYA12_FULL_51_18]|nr:MAG: hypothetical protein A2270_10860 [Elusimicrobia bacterium RIFOXYA12_FULL_51_18]OGS29436.1 MAG: hypothetical protein A2218_00330 [Elusimicrobia bacterium RIFOXYA2_FULL_53_38]
MGKKPGVFRRLWNAPERQCFRAWPVLAVPEEFAPAPGLKTLNGTPRYPYSPSPPPDFYLKRSAYKASDLMTSK